MKLVNGKRSQLLEYLMIIAGTGLMALAINSVFDASGMVTGGFSGIAIIIKAGSQGIIDGGIPLWVTNMGLNIPLFLIGWKINGFSFVKKDFDRRNCSVHLACHRTCMESCGQ